VRLQIKADTMPSPTQPVDVPCGKSEHNDTEEEQEEGPRSWQRFYMGYHERFVDDCVLPLQVGLHLSCLH
jgi:hypothetical protein